LDVLTSEKQRFERRVFGTPRGSATAWSRSKKEEGETRRITPILMLMDRGPGKGETIFASRKGREKKEGGGRAKEGIRAERESGRGCM